MRVAPLFSRRLRRDRRGMAAVEFALIAPALILIGVYAWERRNQQVPRATAQQADIVAELKETEV